MIPVGQKKRGRPATGRDPSISFRIKPSVLSGVEAWAGERGMSRSAALLALLNIGMTGNSGAGYDHRAQNLECVRLRKKITALQAKIAAMRQGTLDVAHVGSDFQIGIDGRL